MDLTLKIGLKSYQLLNWAPQINPDAKAVSHVSGHPDFRLHFEKKWKKSPTIFIKKICSGLIKNFVFLQI